MSVFIYQLLTINYQSSIINHVGLPAQNSIFEFRLKHFVKAILGIFQANLKETIQLLVQTRSLHMWEVVKTLNPQTKNIIHTALNIALRTKIKYLILGAPI